MIHIIAEIAGAHECSIENAKFLAEEAKKAGANSIKHQIYDTDSLVVKEHPKYNRYKEREFNIKQWEEIIKHANKVGINIIFDIFDLKSYNKIKELEIYGYKLPATICEDIPLIKEVSKSNKQIFLGVGGLTLEEIKNTYKEIPVAILLCGVQNSPTQIKDSKISEIKLLKKKLNCKVGYCDHSPPKECWKNHISTMAIATGAEYIEKHICIERKEGGRGAHTSLTPSEFSNFVKTIKEAESAMGIERFELTDSDKDYRHKHKKYIIANKTIPKDKIIEKEDLAFKRLVDPKEIKFKFTEIIEKLKAKKEIKKDEQITEENVD